MPINRADRQEGVKKLRQERRRNGECIQCGTKTLTNPITGRPYALCGTEAKNCRGANNASSNRLYHRKKEDVVIEPEEPEAY